MLKLAIVILNWNGAEMLQKYLPSVMSSSQMEGVQIIVADNASSDNSVAMLKHNFPQIPVISLDENYGFAGGYNKALRQIEAEYYLLLNSDVEIKKQRWVEPLLNYMDQHKEVAACQPKIRYLLQPDMFEYAGAAGGMIDRDGFPFCRGRIFNTIENDHGQYDGVTDVQWCAGCSLLVRSKDYWSVGGLDERFFAHSEEIDLCWRLRLAGHRLVCISDTEVFHLGGATLQQGNPQKTFLNFRNNLLMLYKNLPEEELKDVMRRRMWLDYLAALQMLLKFQWNHFRAVIRARKAFQNMKKEFSSDREKIQQGRTANSMPDRCNFSIIWQYHVLRRKLFSHLQFPSNQ